MINEKFKYKRTLVVQESKILIGGTNSELIDCGGMQPRNLLFPSNWTTSDLKIYFTNDKNGSIFYVLKNFDGSILSDFLIPAVPSLCSIPLIPYLFDSAPYFKIVSQTPQVQQVKIQVLFQPIFQGIHG
jgi:hypothetical protein